SVYYEKVSGANSQLRILTVATETNDALAAFLASAKLRGLPTPEPLGLGSDWLGGDVSRGAGGGQKILLMRRALADVPDDQLVLFSDAYDAVFLAGQAAIRSAFEASGAGVLISAERFCWPDQSLADKYPKPPAGRKTAYLNSGGYMGKAGELRRLLNYAPITDSDDDQLFLTRAFLNPDLRQRHRMALDYDCSVFQTLNGALSEVSLRWDDSGLGYLRNTVTGSSPALLHGNGPIKAEFWRLTNYLGRGWSDSLGCQHCPPMPPPTVAQLLQRQSELPYLTVGVLLTDPAPFPNLLLARLAEQTYPKQRIHLRIDLGPGASARNVHLAVRDFIDNPVHEYASIVLNNASDNLAFSPVSARQMLLVNEYDSDFIFFVEPIAQLTGRDALTQLVAVNRSIVAPLLVLPGKLWSNFWGALNADGYYARSDDYLDIVSDARRGLWNVPYVSAAYLINRRAAQILLKAGAFDPKRLAASGIDYDIDFASIARSKNVFMHVLNTLPFGHLTDNSNTTRLHASNDLWEIWANPVDWEHKYMHPDYWRFASDDAQLGDFEQPCPDVFWLPLVTPSFCHDLVAVMESFGRWSDGTNTDPRLEGGYENVPTRDIHMRQVGWEAHWLHFLVKYMHPIQLKLFQGYSDKPWARMNFVVRYHPEEQKELRPHHDASDYTVNLALNQVGVDFEGGGCRFTRYNCSVIAPRLGWAFVHPGRITHLHEGLEVTKGVRYIFVTFVNP
uniref:Fe2OG dioxygenase domain-containing protein n=2 Tax=Macrostomum lignano TaxID=282301 RepID=A0A1I8JKP9_9PLAT